MFKKGSKIQFGFGLNKSKKAEATEAGTTGAEDSNKRPRIHLEETDQERTRAHQKTQEEAELFHKKPSKDNATENREDATEAPGDDEDELEKYMTGINTRAAQDLSLERTSSGDLNAKTMHYEDEEQDFVDSYIEHMKKGGYEVGSSAKTSRKLHEEYDSDDEVYRTAAEIDAKTMQGQEDGEEHMGAKKHQGKQEIIPLQPVDHSKIQYIEIEKDFYEEHEEIAALAPEDVVRIRRELDMHVAGSDIPRPCISFAHFGFDQALMDAIIRHGYSTPTGIQRQAVPVALSGRDVIGIAVTGSGKTAAFLWPMLVHMMDQPELEKGEGPIGLILAPTRELTHQIYLEAKKFAKAYNIHVAEVYGGGNKHEQFKELRAGGVELLIATPGRLIDLIKMKATNLARVSFLVLDEADRMLDLGFDAQVRSIIGNIRPDRQTLLFSATLPKRIERLARESLTDPIRITIGGGIGIASSDITQIVHIVPDEPQKFEWLIGRLIQFAVEGSVMIFVTRKSGVDELVGRLHAHGFEKDVKALHGDMMQHERDRVIAEFRQGKFNILVATDVASRGLDIKSVRTVVNYDPPRDADSHIHRIGRTGRAGEKGTAYSLVTQKQDKYAADLVRNLEESGVPVPVELMQLAYMNRQFREAREGRRRGRGRGRGRGGRGRGRGRGGGNFQRGGYNNHDRYGNAHGNGNSYRNDRSGLGSHRNHATGSNQVQVNPNRAFIPFQRASEPESKYRQQ